MLVKKITLSVVFAMLVAHSAYGQLILSTESAGGGENDQITEGFDDQDCDCYADLDCPVLQGCDIGSPMCLVTGKMDGLCREWQSPGFDNAPSQAEGIAILTTVVTFYFGQYVEIVKAEGAGIPGPDVVVEIDKLLGWKHRDHSVNKPGKPALFKRQPLINLLNNAMERTLGFDFNISPVQELGNIRLVPDREQAAALVNATQQALLLAIESGNPKAVSRPLTRFWKKYPGYHPNHTGRCYPHGHKNQAPPVKCQIDSLSRIAAALISINEK